MRNLFQSAVNKLTLWYVGALFFVLLMFSIPTYVIESERIERSAYKQAEIFQEAGPGQLGFQPSPRFVALRDQQIRHDRQQLFRSIVIANLIILALGAYLSYQFAKRTLQPIEDAHEAQSRFTTDASHELRTPLATMQAEIEVALRDKQFTADSARQVLASNLEEIARLQLLSDQLLNLARLGGDQLQRTNLQFSKLLNDELSKQQKSHKDAEIKADIQHNVKIQGDEQLLRQLIATLIDNAVKYAGGKPARIEAAMKRKDGAVSLTVTDHGIGIRASDIPHVFDRFYRGSNAASHGKNGHGLGLAIAKQIVDLHEGTIKVSSQAGKYTAFEIRLPEKIPS
jgi:signal transduction histidine kinase